MYTLRGEVSEKILQIIDKKGYINSINNNQESVYGKKTNDVFCLLVPEFRTCDGTNES